MGGGESRFAAWGFALLLLATTACRTPGEACLRVEADVSLNLYDGVAHPTDLYLYPLADTLAFSQLTADALLAGERPASMTQPSPLRVTILPGQSRQIRQQFPDATTSVGVVADFYRRVGDDGGGRSAVVRARCGRRSPPIALLPSRLAVE